MDKNDIISKLPYSKPFLFVDEVLKVDQNGVTGTFTFDENLEFYKGHFKLNPVTPGVILTEVMAQIGVVCLGIFLLDDQLSLSNVIALTSAQIEFYKPVYPNETVTVISTKKYFRFGKLKCNVVMTNAEGNEVCSGVLAGMIVK